MSPITPQAWADHLSGPPVLTSEGFGWRSGLIRRWRGTQPVMLQPPLDHHYLVLHLGGAKSVTQRGAGRSRTKAVAEGAITIVPAGTRYEWVTAGPIDFAHLYVHPARLNRTIATVFDRDPTAVVLDDEVGVEDELLTASFRTMVGEVEGLGGAGRPYLDVLFDTMLAILVRRHSSAGTVAAPARHALAPVRLRRVLDYVEANLGAPITLADLATSAGLSRFHFSRAFHIAMGEPPLTYLTRRRLETAKRRLRSENSPILLIAKETGFASSSHFADSFKRHTGSTPSTYRRQL